jgi:hypothetical protein
MALSFKEFVTQFLNLTLPVKALDAASAAGFTHPPISLRAVISSGKPYAPDVSTVPVVDSSNNPQSVAFTWIDDANRGSTDVNPRRQATSWNLTVWEAPSLHPASTTPVINATSGEGSGTGHWIPEAAGVVQYVYSSVPLHGQYICQITAFNDFGSASTAEKVWITMPGVTPSIAVSYLTNNNWEVKGSGFTPGAEVSVQVWAPGNGGWGGGGGASAGLDGNIQIVLNSLAACSKAGGGQVQFWATDGATKGQSNTVNSTCP